MKETRTILESQIALAGVALEESRPADAEREAQDVIRALGQTPSPLHAIGELITARARLARHDVTGAARALAAAQALSKHTERVSLRSALARVEAEVDAAAGRPDEARRRLDALRATLTRSGMALDELECRLLVLRIDRAEGRVNVRADAAALEKDARARGAGLIVKRLQTL
jgi:hypothetical protein